MSEELSRYGLVPVPEMAPTLARAARSIPVYGRIGVRAFALVDPEDFDACSRHRWHLDRKGYVFRNVRRPDGRRTTQTLHRDVMGLSGGDARQVDHRNHNALDNTQANLRLATPALNGQNRRGGRGASRFRGVWWCKRTEKWAASVRMGGRTHFIGRFTQEQDAADAAAAWRELHMPFTTN